VFVTNSNISAQSRTPFTDLNTIIDYLEEARGTLANPVSLPVRINLGNMTQADSGWQRLLIEIHNSGKPIALDLSVSTMNGTEFNPVNTFSIGKANIVSIILPTVATSIRGGSGGNFERHISAFEHFTELREISGTNITHIGSRAFNGTTDGYVSGRSTQNTKLVSVNFPRVTNIGSYAFMRCVGLVSVDFPAATNIGAGAFIGCSNLSNINFPVVTIIGSDAFDSCTSLTSVDFPRATTIGSGAFENCTSLVSVNFPSQ